MYNNYKLYNNINARIENEKQGMVEQFWKNQTSQRKKKCRTHPAHTIYTVVNTMNN